MYEEHLLEGYTAAFFPRVRAPSASTLWSRWGRCEGQAIAGIAAITWLRPTPAETRHVRQELSPSFRKRAAEALAVPEAWLHFSKLYPDATAEVQSLLRAALLRLFPDIVGPGQPRRRVKRRVCRVYTSVIDLYGDGGCAEGCAGMDAISRSEESIPARAASSKCSRAAATSLQPALATGVVCGRPRNPSSAKRMCEVGSAGPCVTLATTPGCQWTTATREGRPKKESEDTIAVASKHPHSEVVVRYLYRWQQSSHLMLLPKTQFQKASSLTFQPAEVVIS